MLSMLKNSPWLKMGSAAMSNAAVAPQAPMQAPQAQSAMPDQQLSRYNAMRSMMAGMPQSAGVGSSAAPMPQQSEANAFYQMMQKRRPQVGGILSRAASGAFRGI